MALAILKSNQDILLTKSTKTEFLDTLSNVTKTATIAMLQKGFDIYLSKNHVSKYQKKNKSKTKIEEKAIPLFYRPKIETQSSIIEESQFEVIWSMIPSHSRIYDPILLYQTAINGYNLYSLLRACKGIKPIILLIKSKENNVFGLYASRGIAKTHGNGTSGTYLGSRECFLFRILPKEGRYGWQEGAPDTFLLIDDKHLYLGSGGDGPGLFLDNELLNGSSYICETFKNEPLNGVNNVNFEIVSLEAYAINNT